MVVGSGAPGVSLNTVTPARGSPVARSVTWPVTVPSPARVRLTPLTVAVPVVTMPVEVALPIPTARAVTE